MKQCIGQTPVKSRQGAAFLRGRNGVGNDSIYSWPFGEQLFLKVLYRNFQQAGSVVAKMILFQNNWEKQKLGISLHVGFIFKEWKNNKYKQVL